MGMFAGIVGGAMEGAGKAGVSAFHTAQEHLNKKELQDAEQAFQTSLEGVRQSGADRRQTEQIRATRENIQVADDVSHARGVRAAAASDLANAPKMVDDGQGGGMMQAPTEAEKRANTISSLRKEGLVSLVLQMEESDRRSSDAAKSLASHEKIATNLNISHEAIARMQKESSERVAGMSRDIQLQIANIGVTSVITNDGTIALYNKKGESTGFVRDPISGEKLIAKKDLSDTAQTLVRTLAMENTGHAAIIKSGDPSQAPASVAAIQENKREMYRIMGIEPPKEKFPIPTQQDVADRKKRSGDPAFVAAYTARFGPSAATGDKPPAPPPPPAAPEPQSSKGDPAVSADKIPKSAIAERNREALAAREAGSSRENAESMDKEIALAKREIARLPLTGSADKTRRARLAELERRRAEID